MEAWQRDHVRKNLVELQELTICNSLLESHLLANGVLHQVDRNILTYSGNGDKSSKLYEILRTRTNAYVELVKALFECRQTGALKILMAGFRANQVKNVLQLCKLPVDYDRILSTKVEFKGSWKKINDIFMNINAKDLERILEDEQCQQDYIELFVTHEKEFLLITETIPKPPKIYIPRFISNRLKVTSKVFYENRKDIFVFKLVTRAKLSNIVHPNTTSTSTKQLPLAELTSQFILLEYEEDWCELKKMAQNPIHLISVENEDGKDCFLLEDSTGGLITSSRSPDDLNHQKDYISEDRFLERISNSSTTKTVCICDTPGMGKSWLLANIAHKCDLQSSQSIIAFLSLAKFIKHVRPFTQGNNDTLEPLNAVLKYLSPSDLSLHILLYALTTNQLNLELFCDGFDEVLEEDLNWTKSFLKAILEPDAITKVYVTARPHMRQELEVTLSAISYDILPFSEENQVDFLVQSWNQKHSNAVESKLLKFTNFCLQETRSTLNSNDLDIMGKPLQTFLFAEIYSNDAKLYSDPRRQQEAPAIKPTSLYKMYKEFFRLRFETSCDQETAQQVKTFHIWKALELICPEIAKKLDNLEFLSPLDPKINIYSLGILSNDVSHETHSSYFVHRTFAEYLVAECFGDILINELTGRTYSTAVFYNNFNIIANEILSTVTSNYSKYASHPPHSDFICLTWKHPVILYHVNAHVTSCKSRSVSKTSAELFLAHLEPWKAFFILNACVCNNHIQLFRFLIDIMKVMSETWLLDFKSYMSSIQLLTTSKKISPDYIFGTPVHQLVVMISYLSCVETMKDFLFFVKTCLHWDENEIWKRLENTLLCPLKLSLHVGDYELVEYLIDKFSYDYETLLSSCAGFTNGSDTADLKTKINICKFLLMRWTNDPAPASNFKRGITELCYSSRIHIELIKLFVEKGADLKMQISDKANIVHHTASYMSADNFHDFCCFLINTCKASFLFKRNDSLWQYPLKFILQESGELSSETVELILNIPGSIDDGTEERYCSDLVMTAVQHRHNAEILKLLLSYRPGYNYTEFCDCGPGLLHIAAEFADENTTEYLLSLGLSVNQQDSKNITPLLYVFHFPRYEDDGLEVVKLFLKNGANVLAIDNKNENIFHQTARSLSDEYRFDDFVKFVLGLKNGMEAFEHQNKDGQTPLHVRIENKLMVKTKTIETLFQDSSLDVDAMDKKGSTLLLLAHGNLNLIKALVKLGANIRITDEDCNTVIHKAASTMTGEDFDELFKFIMRHTSDRKLLSAKNIGENILHLALSRGEIKEETLRKLLKTPGIEINNPDNYGNTLFLNAVGHNNINILKTLLEHGANARVSNELNSNPLHGDICKNWCYPINKKKEIVEYLVLNGCDATQRDCTGQTPLDLARSKVFDILFREEVNGKEEQMEILKQIISILEKAMLVREINI